MPVLYLLGLAGALLIGAGLIGGRASAAQLPSGPPPPPEPPKEGRRREHEAEDDESAGNSGPPPPGLGTVQPDPPGPGARPPSMADWTRVLAPLCLARGIPTAFAARWVEMESGGNPCAVGYPPAKGPDGYPLEMGIAQLYNPDDLGVVDPRLTGAELRACCVPGDQHETVYKGRRVRGFSGRMARPMTPAEIQRQAEGTVGLIARCVQSATRDLVDVDAGPGWSLSDRGFWALVKLRHALPAVVAVGLPAVASRLGRPPKSWSEFVTQCRRVKFPADVVGRLEFALSNATRCASVVPEKQAVS